MTDIPGSLWLALGQAAAACGSALILSIQRAYEHKTRRQDAASLFVDQQRDLTVPYADNRIPRITIETLALACFSAYDLYTQAQGLSADRSQQPFDLIGSCLVLASWLYAAVLVLVAGRYKLPNDWGFVLNVHLCAFYFVALCRAVWSFYQSSSSSSTTMLPRLVDLLLSADLCFTTATTERGSPFLDENGKRVASVNVSSVIGFLYFTWVTPLVKLAFKKNHLSEEDLPTLPPIYRGYNLIYLFGRSCDRNLLYRIYDANRSGIIIQIVLAVVTSLMYYAPAFFINQLLQLIQDMSHGEESRETGLKHGLLIVLGLGVTIIVLNALVGQLWYFAASSVQVRIKAMLNIEIYRKTLRRMDTAVTAGGQQKDGDDKEDSSNDEDVSSTGQIVNLMSTDSNRISEFSTWWFTIIAAPTELAVGIYFLYNLLGLPCFLGLSVMVIMLPINHYNAKLFAKTQDKLMEARDKRVSLMNEVLQGIRQIKFFASEKNWENRIMKARREELKFLRTTYISSTLFMLVWQGSPLLVTILSFWAFTKLQGNELTAPIAFTSVVIFDEMRFALNALPETFIEFLQALISVRRIQKYLDQDEIVPPPPINREEPVKIGFTNATVAWSASGHDNKSTSALSEDTRLETDGFMIKDLDLEFPNSELSLICGSTGSGKTLLMLSLLGETITIKGEVHCPRASITDTVSEKWTVPESIPEDDWIVDHAVAYVSQTAWLQNASIKDNILFGLPYVEKRYRETLTACALDKDLAILEDGDLTEIGEKGITLSGGQKARVALARAVYSRAKNVLMDDVLSAVDAHTAKHLYEKCITGPLMRGRTRILVTHHVKLCLPGAAYLVHIAGGRANHVGSPAELRSRGVLADILSERKEAEEALQDEVEENAADGPETTTTLTADNNIQVRKAPKVLVEEETRATGKVKMRLYSMYLRMAGGWFFWTIIALLVVGARTMEITQTWWVKKWTQAATPSNVNSLSHHPHEATTFPLFASYIPSNDVQILESSSKDDNTLNYYLTVYILITTTNILIGTSRFAVLYMGVLKASRELYAKLLARVFRAPLRFFDRTPIGRILNRFSKDFETIDSNVPDNMMNFAVNGFVVVSNIIAVSIILPAFIVPILLIAAINIATGAMFVSASRELKRIDSVTRSPLFSHFTETIIGIATIRAFGATRQFLQEMLKRVDTNSRPFYYVWVANRWVSVRFSLLGASINVVAGMAILLSLDKFDASAAGFALSFVLLFTDMVFWAIRRYTSLEMSFNAVERVVEFMEMDQEAPAITDVRPPANWPSAGHIEVRDLEVRYAADLPPVLKGITFTVQAREKIGVVGRTGSGKSTLALSFFRFVEATKGSIVIDDIDIRRIGTEDLRGSLTIIPQDPTLFSGTLRSNMDPFDQFSDDEIFAALRRVHLLPSDEFAQADNTEEEVNANVFRDLETGVSEGGKNFSQGQRQLLCLARALLKRSRVVLMDEATASVDFQTDKAIQKTIATEFADCTILCIAHRLHTVIEYDRILVLDQGQVVEFASPLELILDSNSVFHKMCRNSGEYDSLLALAKAKHQLVDVM